MKFGPVRRLPHEAKPNNRKQVLVSNHNDIRPTVVTGSIYTSVVCTDPPYVAVRGGEIVDVWPVKQGSGPHIAIGIKRWHEIVALAAAAIANAQDYSGCSGAVANVGDHS